MKQKKRKNNYLTDIIALDYYIVQNKIQCRKMGEISPFPFPLLSFLILLLISHIFHHISRLFDSFFYISHIFMICFRLPFSIFISFPSSIRFVRIFIFDGFLTIFAICLFYSPHFSQFFPVKNMKESVSARGKVYVQIVPLLFYVLLFSRVSNGALGETQRQMYLCKNSFNSQTGSKTRLQ